MSIKLGVIGTGVMGHNHARIAYTLPGIELVGVADVDLSRAEEVAQKYRTKPFSDYRQLLAEVDAVVVATPTSTHYEITTAALNAGKHVLVEKPFTGDPTLAQELVDLAKSRSLVLTVGMIESFNPAFIKLQKLLKGEKVHGLDIKRLSPFPERISDTNVIFDMMIHDLHLLKLLVKEKPEDIKATGKKVKTKMLDDVTAVITHETGIITRIHASRVFGSKTRNIVVTAEKFVIDCDLLNKRIYVRDFLSPSPSTVPVKPTDQLIEEQTNFFNVIRGKACLHSLPEDAIAAIQLAKEVEAACL